MILVLQTGYHLEGKPNSFSCSDQITGKAFSTDDKPKPSGWLPSKID